LYGNESVEKSANLVGATKATGYNWLKDWNKEGYDGLHPKPKSGRPPRLSEKNKKKLETKLREKGSWGTREVQDLAKKEFRVEYSTWQIKRIMKKMGMNYAKPLQKDYRRPENAEETLKKTWRKQK
jgi:putative transposase